MSATDKTRVVHYSFAAQPDEGDFVMDVHTVLKKAYEQGIITNFDDGRGRDPWFEGKPGKAIRALRDTFKNAKRNRIDN